MNGTDRVVAALQQRVDALEDEAARLRQPAAHQPYRSSGPFSGSRREVLLGGAGMLGALAGGALLGRAEPASAASTERGPTLQLPEKHLGLRTILAPLKTRGVLWVNHEWDLGAYFVGEQPPVVVATAFDNYMEHDVASCCVCAVTVHGKPGAYRAMIMVRNIGAYATTVEINAVAFGA